MATNPFPSPTIPASYSSFATPNYHSPQPFHHPYENFLPPGYPPVNWQPAIPPYHPAPTQVNNHRNVPGPSHFRSPSPTPGTSGTDDPSDFPNLKDWLESVDRDHLRDRWRHQFSQLSARFELDGLTSLLGLEGMSADTLTNRTGIEEGAAERLLRFACEDIADLRVKGPRAKQARYSN